MSKSRDKRVRGTLAGELEAYGRALRDGESMATTAMLVARTLTRMLSVVRDDVSLMDTAKEIQERAKKSPHEAG